MPGPFPGMDPYLEELHLWPGVHQMLAVLASAALNAALTRHYVATLGERLYFVPSWRSAYGEAIVREQRLLAAATGRGAATASEAPWRITAEPEQYREPFIEILAVREGHRVVTVIEFLSPANKAAGSSGRELYLEKQGQVLKSGAHLIEIDFLRQGEHTIAPPRDRLLERGRWD